MNFVLSLIEKDLFVINESHNNLISNWKKNRDKTDTSYLKLSFNGNPIPFVDEAKILGVIIDTRLSFDQHVTSLCKAINSKSFMLLRSKYLFPLKFRMVDSMASEKICCLKK